MGYSKLTQGEYSSNNDSVDKLTQIISSLPFPEDDTKCQAEHETFLKRIAIAMAKGDPFLGTSQDKEDHLDRCEELMSGWCEKLPARKKGLPFAGKLRQFVNMLFSTGASCYTDIMTKTNDDNIDEQITNLLDDGSSRGLRKLGLRSYVVTDLAVGLFNYLKKASCIAKDRADHLSARADLYLRKAATKPWSKTTRVKLWDRLGRLQSVQRVMERLAIPGGPVRIGNLLAKLRAGSPEFKELPMVQRYLSELASNGSKWCLTDVTKRFLSIDGLASYLAHNANQLADEKIVDAIMVVNGSLDPGIRDFGSFSGETIRDMMQYIKRVQPDNLLLCSYLDLPDNSSDNSSDYEGSDRTYSNQTMDYSPPENVNQPEIQRSPTEKFLITDKMNLTSNSYNKYVKKHISTLYDNKDSSSSLLGILKRIIPDFKLTEQELKNLGIENSMKSIEDHMEQLKDKKKFLNSDKIVDKRTRSQYEFYEKYLNESKRLYFLLADTDKKWLEIPATAKHKPWKKVLKNKDWNDLSTAEKLDIICTMKKNKNYNRTDETLVQHKESNKQKLKLEQSGDLFGDLNLKTFRKELSDSYEKYKASLDKTPMLFL